MLTKVFPREVDFEDLEGDEWESISMLIPETLRRLTLTPATETSS